MVAAVRVEGWQTDSLGIVAGGLDWMGIYCCVNLNNESRHKIDLNSILYHIG